MYSDLIVMTFPNKNDALFAMMGLDISRDKELLGLDSMTVISIKEDGKTAITQVNNAMPYPQGREGAVPGGFGRLIGLALDPKELIEAGLDPRFLQQVLNDLKPNSSALVQYIPSSSVIDTERLLHILSLLRGKLYHTTFPVKLEEVWLKVTTPGVNISN